jgi:hypothetical protein
VGGVVAYNWSPSLLDPTLQLNDEVRNPTRFEVEADADGMASAGCAQELVVPRPPKEDAGHALLVSIVCYATSFRCRGSAVARNRLERRLICSSIAVEEVPASL